MRQVLIYQDEMDWWVAEVPSLPGCATQGRTREEALVNVREAIEAYEEALIERGGSVPEDIPSASVVAV